MIANDLQYRMTRTEVERFERALVDLDGRHDLDPRLVAGQRAAIESQIEELRGQMAEYEALREGQVGAETTAALDVVDSLGQSLIRLRIAAGLTQAELGERLEVHTQQIQRYEASEYQTASLARLMEIAEVLSEALRARSAPAAHSGAQAH